MLLYWGWYWRQVYDSAHLIAAQLLFAYAFDMLLSWSRRDTYTLGLRSVPRHLQHQPVPLVQAGLVLPAVPDGGGRLRRQRADPLGQGRPARPHLQSVVVSAGGVFARPCSLTGTSDLTWGQDIATTQFYPPHMYLMLFLIGLPGQFFFGVTTMTMSAVVTTYLFGLLYYAATGIYFFYDSYIPIAVFLGMHLLFTDPSTSPRTELGRVMFGVLYGLSTVALYAAARATLGLPTFYDKLLQVPILNLSIKLIDRAARSNAAATHRPGRARPIARATPAASRVHVGVGGRVRGDERGAGRRRQPSGAVAAVLATGLRGGAAVCLPVPREHHVERLRPRFPLGVQGSSRILQARSDAGSSTHAGERVADARRLPDHSAGQQRSDHGIGVEPGSKPSRAAKAGPARVIGDGRGRP